MAEVPSVGRMRLGSQGLEVSALGLGCMGMSDFYGPPKPDQEMISTMSSPEVSLFLILRTFMALSPTKSSLER